MIHTLGCPIDFNGNITRVLGQAISVARRGIDVRVIVSNHVPQRYFEMAIHNGVKIDRYSNVMIPWKDVSWRINNIFPLFSKILEIVNNESNTIFHIAAPTPVTKPLTASEVGKRLKKPILLDIHDPWSSSPFSFNPILMLQTSIMRRVISNADFIVVPYKALLKLVKSIDRTKPVAIIPNAVDTNLFRPRARNITLAQSLNMDDHNIVVAFSGHVGKSKGLTTLVHSARIINRISKNVRFLIIGDGPSMNEVRSLTKTMGLNSIFRFIGFVSQESVVDYLSLADICVAPYEPMAFFKVSLPETPLKVVEYLAMGKPVVMSRISSDNVINWSKGGLLVTPGDASDLASKIMDLVEDETLRENLGKNGRRYVESKLSWEKISETLVEIYKFLEKKT